MAENGQRSGALLRVMDRIAGGQINDLQEAVEVFGRMAFEGIANEGLLVERISELELALEDSGWTRMAGQTDRDFTRAAIETISRTARLYWLKNPLIKRAVYTQTAYVFGQGCEITAKDEAVGEVVDAFLKDPKNVAEFAGHQARMLKETELQIESNLFFVFFVNQKTGAVRVRTIPQSEIRAIVTNPEDSKEPWYYLREWDEPKKVGSDEREHKKAYYPDFRYNDKKRRPRILNGQPVMKEQVYHVKVNCLPDMAFGVSELYAALDWSRAYKEFLEDWATLVKALSRFAWKFVSKAGAKGVDAAKAKLEASASSSLSDPLVANLPPAAGSTLFMNDAVQFEPIPKTGATTSADDGRRLLLMVSAATGIFEHYFGDPNTGNLATARTMERPMELMFRDRQELWRDIFVDMCDYAIDQSIIAPSGDLSGTVSHNDYGERIVEIEGDQDRSVQVSFPPLLEEDPKARIDAIVSATTMGGQEPAGTLDLQTATRLLLTALGESDIEELMDTLFPEDQKDWASQQEEDDAKALKRMQDQQSVMGEQVPQGAAAVAKAGADSGKGGATSKDGSKDVQEADFVQDVKKLRTAIIDLMSDYSDGEDEE